MRTVTIRQLRQRWPETEEALQLEGEIIITRDGQPVARLTSVSAQKPRRVRWNPGEHEKWLKQTWGNKQTSLVDKYLLLDREDTRRRRKA